MKEQIDLAIKEDKIFFLVKNYKMIGIRLFLSGLI
ncbi:Uncharacterised protein [Klebsiella pneumoniae]|nr:Uncharacterised protein [Klebsiella pneumoniae]